MERLIQSSVDTAYVLQAAGSIYSQSSLDNAVCAANSEVDSLWKYWCSTPDDVSEYSEIELGSVNLPDLGVSVREMIVEPGSTRI